MHRFGPRPTSGPTIPADMLILVYMPSGGRWPRICDCTVA